MSVLPDAPLRADHDPSPMPAPFGRIAIARGVGPAHTEIASARCEAEPVCALVIAVYAAAPW